MEHKKQTLVIEINEFNIDLLRHAADCLNLKNLQRILSYQQGTTTADQIQEHQGLDPWVQWVSIHAETPSQAHQIIRLGGISKLTHSQIWERLSRSGITTGVWGIMNGAKKNSPSNQFFVTDPWTFTETAYPKEINSFLALPVYYSKNYLDLSLFQLISNGIKTAWFALRHIKLHQLISDTVFLLRGLVRTKKLSTSFLFCAYELISTRLFFKYKNKFKPCVNFVFINAIAHFQHHEWQGGQQLDAVSTFVFSCLDRMLGIILPDESAEEQVLVLNALSQRNVSEEHHYCYRQINPHRFLINLGLKISRVEQCMTNDAHVFFTSSKACDQAARVLSSATVANQSVFFVEKDLQDPLKLFYQVAIWNKLDDSALIQFEDRKMPFFSEFAIYAKRTGAHIPTGTYLAHRVSLPKHMNNSDIFSFVWPKEMFS